MSPPAAVWPKTVPQLSERQERIRNDFVRHWHEVLPSNYGVIERFNHGYPARFAQPGQRTLEIGAGLGEHFAFEPGPHAEYTAVELREEMAEGLRRNHPEINAVVGDCQARLPFDDDHFDRALAIHVLEHLPNLPAAVAEIHRVLKPGGRFVVVIPCEGGLAYGLGRRISAQRIFERRYRESYDWFIGSEHLNVPAEILPVLEERFAIDDRTFFPLHAPVVTANVVIGLALRPR